MEAETISADDLQILREAVTQLERAATSKVFVEDFLARKYKLQNGDSVDIATAEIKRKDEGPHRLDSAA